VRGARPVRFVEVPAMVRERFDQFGLGAYLEAGAAAGGQA
jgi:hypothetical protein